MSLAASAPAISLGEQRLRRCLALHPEWWAMALSAGCWFYLLSPVAWFGGCSCGLCGLGTGGWTLSPWLKGLGDWVVMVLAMMLPLMVIPIRAAAFNSLWPRRHRAIAAFLLGYVAIWTAAGVPGLALLGLLRPSTLANAGWLGAAAFLAAAAWHSSPPKRRLAAACHWTRPLAPDGWEADWDCFRFGLGHGLPCVGNCGPLMLAAMLSPWPQPMMAAATLLLLLERYWTRPRDRSIPAILGLLAASHWLL